MINQQMDTTFHSTAALITKKFGLYEKQLVRTFCLCMHQCV